MKNDIIDCPDIIDTRDLQSRIGELEGDLADLELGGEEATQALNDWKNENAEELKALQEFADEISDSCQDYKNGEALIKEDYFEEYARELAEYPSNVGPAAWPYRHINWAEAAAELRVDYDSAELNGETYYFKC